MEVEPPLESVEMVFDIIREGWKNQNSTVGLEVVDLL